jgi:signal peptidase I
MTGLGTVFVHPYCYLGGIALMPLPRLLAAGDLLRRARNPPIVWGRTLKIWVLLFLVGMGAAYLVRSFLVEAFRLPSGSMMPTLLVGDHFAVDKFPRALVRGDLITFKWPVAPDKNFMKRVIAVEGDSVEVRDNVVFLNGQPVERKPLGTRTYPDWISDGSGPERAVQLQAEVWQESLLGRVYEVQQEPGRPPHTFPPHQVPRDAVFVMGDNRDNSSDSRVWGHVPLSLVKGKVLMVWWSEVQDTPRWSRIGMLPR